MEDGAYVIMKERYFHSLYSDSQGRPVTCVMSVFQDNRLWANPRSVPTQSEHQMTRYTHLPMRRHTHTQQMDGAVLLTDQNTGNTLAIQRSDFVRYGITLMV